MESGSRIVAVAPARAIYFFEIFGCKKFAGLRRRFWCPSPVGQNAAPLLILWRSENFAPFRQPEQNPFIRVVTTDDKKIKTFINQTMKSKKRISPLAPATRTPAAAPAGPKHTEITREVIAACAYTIWEQAGRPNGRDLEFWVQAEQQLKK
jgi:hypothetical protein